MSRRSKRLSRIDAEVIIEAANKDDDSPDRVIKRGKGGGGGSAGAGGRAAAAARDHAAAADAGPASAYRREGAAAVAKRLTSTPDAPADERALLPRYEVSLDAPPALRWVEVGAAFGERVRALVAGVEAQIAGEWMTGESRAARLAKGSLMGAVRVAAAAGALQYDEEVAGFAKCLGIDAPQLHLAQLIYESFAACTSVVVEGPRGPVLGRTLDWAMPELGDLLIDVSFGFVGLLTAVKPGAFAASINYRTMLGVAPLRRDDSGDWAEADESFAEKVRRVVHSALCYTRSATAAACRGWPASLLLRRVFEEAESFDAAVATLSETLLIAPVYFTVSGVRAGEGVTVTRDRAGPAVLPGGGSSRWCLRAHGAVVQANMDHWERGDPQRDVAMGESLYRRELGRQLAASLQASRRFGPASVALLLQRYPVGNEMTIHWTAACAATGFFASAPSWWHGRDAADGKCTITVCRPHGSAGAGRSVFSDDMEAAAGWDVLDPVRIADELCAPLLRLRRSCRRVASFPASFAKAAEAGFPWQDPWYCRHHHRQLFASAAEHGRLLQDAPSAAGAIRDAAPAAVTASVLQSDDAVLLSCVASETAAQAERAPRSATKAARNLKRRRDSD